MTTTTNEGGAPAGAPSLSASGAVIPGLVEHLSASSVGTYLRCPRRWWFKYVAKQPEGRDGGLIAGSAMHEVAEHVLTLRMQGFDLLSPTEAEDLARGYVESMSAEAGLAREDIDFASDRSARQTRVWATEVAPGIVPVAVEAKFDTTIEGIRVIGRLDLVDSDGICHDWKTKSRKPTEDEHMRSVQSEIYARVHGGPIGYTYLIDRPKLGTAEVVRRVIQNEGDLRALREMADESVSDVARSIRSGAFPRRRDHHMCSQKWCPHFTECQINRTLKP